MDARYTTSSGRAAEVRVIDSDRDADYILFDGLDCPIRFVISESFIKFCFRTLRGSTIYREEPVGLEMVAEYIIKAMAHRPEISREMILAQFQREYGERI